LTGQQGGGAAAVANGALPGIADSEHQGGEAAAAASDAELAADAILGDVEQAAQQAAQNAEQANAEQAIADLQERQEILGDFILRCFRVV